MMGPLSFSLPTFQFLCSQWLPTAEGWWDPKDRVHENPPPREEEGNRGRLACTFLMATHQTSIVTLGHGRMNQTSYFSKPQWPVPFGHRVKRCLFSTELTCFPSPTFSRRVAPAALLACSPEKDDTLHTEESGPNCSPAPLKLVFKGVCVQMPSIITNTLAGPLHIHPPVQFTESIFSVRH